MSREILAELFDHTNLKSWATSRDIDFICQEAEDNKFHAVCVFGYWVPYVKENFPSLKIVQVLAFPDGLSTSYVQVLSEVDANADEYDMVLNLSKLKEHQTDELIDEVKKIKAYVGKKILKVIVETAVLTQNELYDAIQVVYKGGADFIKTSTGMIIQSEEKLIDQVALIQAYIKLHHIPIEIKASGGIKTLDLVKMLIGLGVTRIGSSNSVKILNELGHL